MRIVVKETHYHMVQLTARSCAKLCTEETMPTVLRSALTYRKCSAWVVESYSASSPKKL